MFLDCTLAGSNPVNIYVLQAVQARMQNRGYGVGRVIAVAVAHLQPQLKRKNLLLGAKIWTIERPTGSNSLLSPPLVMQGKEMSTSS
jgi:hypothetical protein